MKAIPRRRRFARLPAENAVLLERNPTEEMPGAFAVARDLGPGGCGVVSPGPLGTGSLLKLYMSFDSEILEANGRVVHERPRPDGRYDVGVEILQMDNVHRARYNLRLAGVLHH